MTKKKLFTGLLVCALLLSLVGCGNGTYLGFATGGSEGVYYAFGTVLADVIQEKTDTKMDVNTSAGSQENLEDIGSSKADIALAQSDVMNYAYNGNNIFEGGEQIDNFSVIAALYMEPVQIVTCDPNVKSIDDLAGKTVSIGAEGSGVYYNALDILNVYGLSESDITPVYQDFGESADSLEDGSIEAAFIVAGAPTQAITYLSSHDDFYLLGIDEDHINDLIALSPYYTEDTISADVYGLDEDTTTVAVDAILVTSNDVSDDDVYNIISGIFDNIDEISEQYEKGEELNLDFASSVTGVPYHASAAKYFEQQGISVPTN